MNIPNKYLQNNNLSNEKILFYQKLASKYTMAFTKYHKKLLYLKCFYIIIINVKFIVMGDKK